MFLLVGIGIGKNILIKNNYKEYNVSVKLTLYFSIL